MRGTFSMIQASTRHMSKLTFSPSLSSILNPPVRPHWSIPWSSLSPLPWRPWSSPSLKVEWSDEVIKLLKISILWDTCFIFCVLKRLNISKMGLMTDRSFCLTIFYCPLYWVVSLCLGLVCDCVWIRVDHENTGGVPGLESVGSKEVCPGPVERDQRASLSCGVTGGTGPQHNIKHRMVFGLKKAQICMTWL